jgi:hypothetical protein
MVADIQVAWFSAERYHSAGLAGQAAKLARACRPVKRYAARALGSATRRAFLFHLAFYLVRHRGRLRRVISSRRDTTRPVSEIWRRLLGKGGMDVDEVAPGESCVIRLGSDCNEARVEIVRAGRSLACRLTDLNDGLTSLLDEVSAV